MSNDSLLNMVLWYIHSSIFYYNKSSNIKSRYTLSIYIRHQAYISLYQPSSSAYISHCSVIFYVTYYSMSITLLQVFFTFLSQKRSSPQIVHFFNLFCWEFYDIFHFTTPFQILIFDYYKLFLITLYSNPLQNFVEKQHILT